MKLPRHHLKIKKKFSSKKFFSIKNGQVHFLKKKGAQKEVLACSLCCFGLTGGH
jgi:hypothetical protein